MSLNVSWSHSFLILNTEIKICAVSNFFFLFKLFPGFRFSVKNEKTTYNKFICLFACACPENVSNLPKLTSLVMKTQFLFIRLNDIK